MLDNLPNVSNSYPLFIPSLSIHVNKISPTKFSIFLQTLKISVSIFFLALSLKITGLEFKIYSL